MAGDEHYVYLTNLGNRDVHPDNTPGQFENRLNPPLHLDPNKDYEVALVNCLYPKTFYSIPKHDYSGRIEIWATAHVKPEHSYLLYTFLPQSNIEAGDTRYMIHVLNAELSIALKDSLRNQYSRYFKSESFFQYNEALRRTDLMVHKGICTSDEHFCKLAVRFGSRMAQCLGYEFPAEYTIYDAIVPFADDITPVPAPFPPRQDGGVDFGLFYSDCVTPTMYGGQMVNLLAAVTMETAGGRDFHQVTYKPLNKSLIDSISIKVTDQKGRSINYGWEKTMVVLLHIRPK